jgi:hypothetical protein
LLLFFLLIFFSFSQAGRIGSGRFNQQQQQQQQQQQRIQDKGQRKREGNIIIK